MNVIITVLLVVIIVTLAISCDHLGNIPLMYAAQMDYCDILDILAKHKPSLKMTVG